MKRLFDAVYRGSERDEAVCGGRTTAAGSEESMPRILNGGGKTPSLLARASARAGNGASILFAKLDAGNTRAVQGAEVLARLAERLRAGAWNPELADLVARAEAAEKALDEAK